MLEAQTSFYQDQLALVDKALSTLASAKFLSRVTSTKFRAHLLRAKRIFEFEMGQSKEKYMQIMASSAPPQPEPSNPQSSEQTPPQLSLNRFIKKPKTRVKENA